MIVEPDFLHHWKTTLLITLLDGDKASPLYVIRLWAHCQMRKRNAFDGLSNSAIKAICQYDGCADKLVASLIESGYLEKDDSTTTVSNWNVVNSYLVRSWENGKKGGRPPKETKTEPSNIPVITHSEPIREDRIGLDKKKTTSSAKPYTASLALLDSLMAEIPDDRRELYATWLQYKRERRETYKPSGFSALVKKFSAMPTQDLKSAIENSMANNYSGIFEPKPTAAPKKEFRGF